MANVLSAEQGIINTNIGPYYIPIVTIAEKFSDFTGDTISIGLNYNIFSGIKHSYFTGAEGTNICAPFNIGSRLSLYRTGSNQYIKWDETSMYLNFFPNSVIPFLIRDGEGAYAVHQVTTQGNVSIPVEYNPLGFGAVQTQIVEGSFGVLTCNMSGNYTLTNSRLSDSIAIGSYLMNYFPVIYTWTAWEQIAGNGGQYRCDLTKIKDESIGDFSAIQTGDSSDFDRISSQSSIWNIFHNMGFDEVRKIAWSGGNYMTMRLNEEPEYPSQYTFTFSFYNIVTVGGEQTPSLIWQDTFPITWTGDTRDTDFYLSFVYDPDKEVALFVPITKDTAGAYEWGWSGGLPTEVTMNNLYHWLTASENPEVITPYTQGTEDNGGTPGGSIPQSHIDVPTAPTLGAMTSGMFTLYCPDDTELQHISQFLWSDGFISNIKKYFNNVSDNIMALYVLPYKPSNNPVKTFKVGNMVSDDSALSAVEYVDDRFVTIDMGDVKIKPFWGSYLDYAPYSSLQVVLPGVGVQTLDVDDIFCPADENGDLPAPSEATIHIDYTIDLMTGVLVAFISINGEMRYQFPGKLGYQIPLTGENYVRMAQGFVTAAAGLIGTIASAGAAAPFTAPAATAGIINAMKPDVYRGGNLSGDASMLARLTPTLIYRRPNKPLLPDQGEFTGFPSYKIGNLSEFSGYTEVLDAHVEGISCTDEERVLILEALKEGVII